MLPIVTKAICFRKVCAGAGRKGGRDRGERENILHSFISFIHSVVSGQAATMYQVLRLLSTEDKTAFKTISTLLQLLVLMELFLN